MENTFVNYLQKLGLKTGYGYSSSCHVILFNDIKVAEYRYNVSSILEKGLFMDLNIDIKECCGFRYLSSKDSRYGLKHMIYGEYVLDYKPYKSLSYSCDYTNEDVFLKIDFDELAKCLVYSISHIKKVLVDIEKAEIRNDNVSNT